jgi:3'(2'), 5'-bisphosphate nucleotidase
MIDLNSPEIRFAFDTVRQASLLVKQVQTELVTPALTKNDRSPVTVADYAAQAFVASRLAHAFPDDVLVGEEEAGALRAPEGQATLEIVRKFVGSSIAGATAEQVCAWIDRGAADPLDGKLSRYWTLDPIDGTKGFLRGNQYAVALALLESGRVQVGVLGCPNLDPDGAPNFRAGGSLAVAVRGQGAWACDLRQPGEFLHLHVSGQPDPAQARLLRSFESRHTNVDQIDDFIQALGIRAEAVRMDSQAKYAVMAAGRGELLLRLLSADKPDYKEKIWDQAAGALIVEEAGGRISDLHGRTLDFTAGRTLTANRGILASNGVLHPAALRALQQISA